MFSFSSKLDFGGFRVDMERWMGRESFRGLLFVGILDIRKGIEGGVAEVEALLELK